MRDSSDFEPIAPQRTPSARERLLNLLLAVERKRKNERQTISRRPEGDGPQPLSFAQERLWFLDQLGLVGSAYNVTRALRLSGELSEGALGRSFAELVRRHESLRTRFELVDGVPHQRVVAPEPLRIRREDLSRLPDAAHREQVLHELIQRDQDQRFHLGAAPLLRVTLVFLAPQEHALILTLHHIASDGWSSGILVRELSTLYAAEVSGEPSPLAELPIQYADYALWQRGWLQGEALQEQLQYWRDRLQGAPPQLQLPTDRPRPPVESFRGSTLDFELPLSVTQALKDVGQREGATLFMVILAAYQVLLWRWSGQQDIVVGSPIAGRRHRESEGLIGFFVNTLALRVELSGELTFRQLLERVKEMTLGAYAHQDVPFEALVKELRPERNLARQPIFQVALALQNFPEDRLELPQITWTRIDVDLVTTHFDLTLFLSDGPAGLSGLFEFATDLFDRATIERMAGHFRTLLEGVVANPDSSIQELPLLRPRERQHVLVELNATAAPQPPAQLIHKLFEAQMARTPHVAAVICREARLTYAELDRRSNRLAHYLLEKCVGPDEVVGVYLERGIDLIVGLLGILKAGGAYLPLDPNYPAERLQYMLEDSAPRVVLTQTRLRGSLPPTTAAVAVVDDDAEEFARCDDAPVDSEGLELSPANLLYVIYTSGSTGRPKGTAMPHGAMANLMEWHRRALPLEEGQRVLQFAALSFDVAFQEIFSTLCGGGSLVLVNEWTRKDAPALMRHLHAHAVERLFVPPLMLQALAECFEALGEFPATLRDVIAAGEQLRVTPQIVSLMQRIGGCRLHNHYGPTETHVVTALTLEGDPGRWPVLPTIGRPIANTQIYILDDRREPVDVGIVGQIYIGGANLARGYLHRPELTMQRFVRDPFSTNPGARLYCTGDVGRWLSDGTIEFLGRNDDQVKIRGHRIELGEIEAHLARHEQIRDVAVVVRPDSAGDKCLVAYVTLRRGPAPAARNLRAHAKSVLPEHMIPSAFVVLEHLPLTPSGKLNRRALPAPGPGAFLTREYEPPQGPVEETLADIWQDLLGVPRVGRCDNFFELGGHSLHGIRLITKIAERLGASLSVIAIFQHPTIEDMARIIESEGAGQAVTGAPSLQFEDGAI
jgi:surfactin family lipopeptide synthetase A